jgi:hypothetical protein
MSELLIKVQPETVPSLDNTKWAMYNVSGTTITPTGVTWHFTPPNDVHDDPECWHGHWAQNTDKIIITRKNVASPYTEYTYEAIFAGTKVMVVSGNDETKNRILIGLFI